MIGIFSKTIDSSFVEAAGLAGLDFIILDQEHGPVGRDRLYDHVRAAKVSNMQAIVRVQGLNENLISAALDSGADAVQVPNIVSADQATRAVKAAKFFPVGNRGVCRFVKAADYGLKDKKEYFMNSNLKSLVLQVEGEEGVENIESILQVQGFEVLFIGPYDLSQSLGIPGDIEDPRIRKNIQDISTLAKEYGKKVGSFADSPRTLRLLIDCEVDFISYSVDINLFAEKIKSLLDYE